MKVLFAFALIVSSFEHAFACEYDSSYTSGICVDYSPGSSGMGSGGGGGELPSANPAPNTRATDEKEPQYFIQPSVVNEQPD